MNSSPAPPSHPASAFEIWQGLSKDDPVTPWFLHLGGKRLGFIRFAGKSTTFIAEYQHPPQDPTVNETIIQALVHVRNLGPNPVTPEDVMGTLYAPAGLSSGDSHPTPSFLALFPPEGTGRGFVLADPCCQFAMGWAEGIGLIAPFFFDGVEFNPSTDAHLVCRLLQDCERLEAELHFAIQGMAKNNKIWPHQIPLLWLSPDLFKKKP